MSITAVPLGTVSYGFAINATSADLSACEEILAAPSSGSIVLEQIHITTQVKDMTVTIGAGETTNACTTIIVGPISFNTEITAAGWAPFGQYSLVFTRPIKLAAVTSLTVDASGAGLIQLFASGYYI